MANYTNTTIGDIAIKGSDKVVIRVQESLREGADEPVIRISPFVTNKDGQVIPAKGGGVSIPKSAVRVNKNGSITIKVSK